MGGVFIVLTNHKESHMNKKFLLATLLLFSAAKADDNTANANGFELVMANYRTTPLDISFWQHAQIIGASSLLSAGTWLATRCIVNIFQAKKRDLDLINFATWSLPETIITPASFALYAKLFFDNQTPKGIAYNANKNGLLNALLACSTQEEIESTLDRLFVAESFPRTAAFGQLNIIRDSLKRVYGLVVSLQASKPNRHFKQVTEVLSTNINLVEKILLLIKNDIRWFEECNATTLSHAQATQQANLNAKLAESAINIAHAYAQAR